MTDGCMGSTPMSSMGSRLMLSVLTRTVPFRHGRVEPLRPTFEVIRSYTDGDDHWEVRLFPIRPCRHGDRTLTARRAYGDSGFRGDLLSHWRLENVVVRASSMGQSTGVHPPI